VSRAMCERARHSTSVAVFHCETERTGRRVLRSVHGCVHCDSVSDVKARETERVRDERRGAGPPGTDDRDRSAQTIPDPERHSRHASCSLMLK
jgi:hypothetical protein